VDAHDFARRKVLDQIDKSSSKQKTLIPLVISLLQQESEETNIVERREIASSTFLHPSEYLREVVVFGETFELFFVSILARRAFFGRRTKAPNHFSSGS
jgi:hypothetical protein